VLVTGGAGFIGSHTAARLARDGHLVRVLDNLETGNRENLAGAVGDLALIDGDVRRHEEVLSASEGCEVVFHLAALTSIPRSIRDPVATHASNVTGTLNVLRAARENGVRRVVFASSSSVYGPSAVLPKTEDLPASPISPYAVGKLAGEGYCRSFSELHGLEAVTLRYFNVFGPHQDPRSEYAAVIPRFISAAIAGRPVTVFGDGGQSRDFTYVDNVVDANLGAMAAGGVSGQVFNVACGRRFTINELLGELRLLTGREVSARYEDARPGDIRHSLADTSCARTALGYRATVSFREGVARTLRHHEGRLRVLAEVDGGSGAPLQAAGR
jgi:UDP-glucose 4-epimerase